MVFLLGEPGVRVKAEAYFCRTSRMPKLRVVNHQTVRLVAEAVAVPVAVVVVAATALVVELAASLPVPATAAVTETVSADQKVVPNRSRL